MADFPALDQLQHLQSSVMAMRQDLMNGKDLSLTQWENHIREAGAYVSLLEKTHARPAPEAVEHLLFLMRIMQGKEGRQERTPGRNELSGAATLDHAQVLDINGQSLEPTVSGNVTLSEGQLVGDQNLGLDVDAKLYDMQEVESHTSPTLPSSHIPPSSNLVSDKPFHSYATPTSIPQTEQPLSPLPPCIACAIRGYSCIPSVTVVRKSSRARNRIKEACQSCTVRKVPCSYVTRVVADPDNKIQYHPYSKQSTTLALEHNNVSRFDDLSRRVDTLEGTVNRHAVQIAEHHSSMDKLATLPTQIMDLLQERLPDNNTQLAARPRSKKRTVA